MKTSKFALASLLLAFAGTATAQQAAAPARAPAQSTPVQSTPVQSAPAAQQQLTPELQAQLARQNAEMSKAAAQVVQMVDQNKTAEVWAGASPVAKGAAAQGEFVKPALSAFRAAIIAGGLFKNSLEPSSLLNLGGSGVWPIVTATYVLVPREPVSQERASRTLHFFYQSFLKGDSAVAGTGFAPLPISTQARIVGLLSNFKTPGGQSVKVIGDLGSKTVVAAH